MLNNPWVYFWLLLLVLAYLDFYRYHKRGDFKFGAGLEREYSKAEDFWLFMHWLGAPIGIPQAALFVLFLQS
ncbi:hypothetical protein [Sulfitobacter pacificus]|uniref:hypothetical protein n=1 Tax=Sulfitobacter pacificus TaxID=1499314 RepID=UPI00310C3918